MTDQIEIVAVDSLVANEFEVQLNGEAITGIFRVDGLTTFKLDQNGERVHEPVTLVKMVQRDGNTAINKWLRETMAYGSDKPRRHLTIVAIDDGVETRRWTLRDAWIQQVCYSAFDTASTEMVEEILTIYYESIEETWSATPNLE
ncbi:MAG: hypothetical protein Kow00117_09110 [Phototrophicales bacterium]|nr:MAG: hypothetical protein CUN56_05855 [Phototrophicales bacterium]RMG74124.1 MAG: hypothetical protein D6711_09670 [Chloroflexota bacterium]